MMKIKELLIDAVALVGLAALGYGVWLIHKPSSFIVIGILLIIWSVMSSLGSNDKRAN